MPTSHDGEGQQEDALALIKEQMATLLANFASLHTRLGLMQAENTSRSRPAASRTTHAASSTPSFEASVDERNEPDPIDENEAVADDQPAQRHAGTRRMRRRNLDGASTSMAAEAERDEEIEEEELQTNYYASKSSKKKEMKKQDKEARRQAEDASRDLRIQKKDRYAEMRRRKDEEREAEELRKEEEARLQRIKEEEAANAEFEMWKDGFTVDNEGTMEEEMKQETGGLLHDFIEYIKSHKCVQLEDLAAEFHIRTQDAISRIVSLEEVGRLSGVMDDRGKFIYISMEEMKSVAEYIKSRGRVSIAHLAGKSNEFIDLEPKTVQDDVIT
ncbi:hypothetical protein L7F22_018744 [Adiantum nelumboides]|nr:hypothetical protein [Adiantum nelumboides]